MSPWTAITLFLMMTTIIAYLDRIVAILFGSSPAPGEPVPLGTPMGTERVVLPEASPDPRLAALPVAAPAPAAPPPATLTAPAPVVPAVRPCEPAPVTPVQAPEPARPAPPPLRVIDIALRDLASPDPAKVDRSRVLIENLGTTSATPLLIHQLTAPDRTVARRAAELLFKLGDERAIPYLLEYLRQNDPAAEDTAPAEVAGLPPG